MDGVGAGGTPYRGGPGGGPPYVTVDDPTDTENCALLLAQPIASYAGWAKFLKGGESSGRVLNGF